MGFNFVSFIPRAVMQGIPLLYGSTGEILTEKSGNLNLGIPGIMYVGGISGVIGAFFYEQAAGGQLNGFLAIMIPILCSLLGSLLMGLLYCFLTVTLRANQNVTGLALTTFGMGVANFFGVFILNGASYSAAPIANKAFSAKIPVLSGLGDIGQVVFSYGFLVYAAILLAVVLHWFLTRTRAGLNLRAVGENPATADAAGINVTLYKYLSTCIGAGICGIGGAYCSMIINGGVWLRDSVGGLGWISVALVIFAAWKPINVIYGSFIFGALRVLKYYVPKNTYAIPTAFFDALPFIITALVLVIASMRKNKGAHIPAHLGENYFREER